jgi:hypothetical protein
MTGYLSAMPFAGPIHRQIGFAFIVRALLALSLPPCN